MCCDLRCEVEGECPKGEGGGEDIGVSERALSEPDGISGSQQGDRGCGEVSCEAASEPKNREERGGGDDADKSAGAADDESGLGRVGVGDGGVGDEGAGAEEVERGGDVVAALVPEIRETKQSPMADEDEDEEDRVEHP